MYRARSAILVSLLLILLAGTCFTRSEAEEENVVRLEFREPPTLLDSILCWIQRATYTISDSFRSFVSSLRRNVLDQLIPARSSFPFGSPFGNAGAAEPTSITSLGALPPNIPHRKPLKFQLIRLMRHVLYQYRFTPVAEAATCHDVMRAELHNLMEIATSHLKSFCSSDSVDRRKFCKFFELNYKMAVATFFAKMEVDPIRAVVRHVGDQTECATEWETKVKQSRLSHATSLTTLRDKDLMLQRLNQLCDNPTSLFAFPACWLHKYREALNSNGAGAGAGAGALPQPFYYRRAMMIIRPGCSQGFGSVTVISSSGSLRLGRSIPLELQAHFHDEKEGGGGDFQIVKTGEGNPGTASI